MSESHEFSNPREMLDKAKLRAERSEIRAYVRDVDRLAAALTAVLDACHVADSLDWDKDNLVSSKHIRAVITKALES